MRLRTSVLIAFLGLAAVFVLPVAISLKEFSSFQWSELPLLKIYTVSSKQALVSALGTIFLALFCAQGMFWLKNRLPLRLYFAAEFLILLPSLLPALFIVICFLNAFSYFPLGITGIVILHICSEIGITTLLLQRVMAEKLSPYFDSAELMGVGRGFFLRRTLPLILPELAQMFAILFVFYLTSLSIPLIMSGARYTSIELSIYEKIVSHHDWNQALNLYLVQIAFVALCMSVLRFVPPINVDARLSKRATFLENAWGILPVFFPVVVILASLILQFPKGFVALQKQPNVLYGWERYLIGSFFIGFLCGACTLFFLLAASFFYQFRCLQKYFVWLNVPSVVIVGFSFFLLPGTTPMAYFFKICGSLTLVFLPTLLRLGLFQDVDRLRDQIEMGEYLGASPWRVYSQIVLPQVLPVASLMSGLAAIWGIGDFALSRVIAGRDLSLAMWIQSLVDQYRWDMALTLSWLLLFTSVVVFLFFWGLSYVASQKLT